jgi:hypothetical protein
LRAVSANCPDYVKYGCRGIKVCQRLPGFFISLTVLSKRLEAKHSIGPASMGVARGECDHCQTGRLAAQVRWATWEEQNGSKRRRRSKNATEVRP